MKAEDIPTAAQLQARDGTTPEQAQALRDFLLNIVAINEHYDRQLAEFHEKLAVHDKRIQREQLEERCAWGGLILCFVLLILLIRHHSKRHATPQNQ